MKKIIRVLALFLLIAAMFTGCEKDVQEEKKEDTPSIMGPLFSSDETTADADCVDLSAGKWIYRYNEKRTTLFYAAELQFSALNSEVDQIAEYTYIFNFSETLPDGTTKAELSQKKAKGFKIKGNTALYYKKYSKNALADLHEALLVKYGSDSAINSADDDPEALTWEGFSNIVDFISEYKDPTHFSGDYVVKQKTDASKFYIEHTDDGFPISEYFAKQ